LVSADTARPVTTSFDEIIRLAKRRHAVLTENGVPAADKTEISQEAVDWAGKLNYIRQYCDDVKTAPRSVRRESCVKRVKKRSAA
jgi:hypothetical protein